MPVSIGDVIRVTCVLDSSLEGTVQNVWHAVQVSGSATDLEWINAARTRFNSAYDNIDALMPDTVSFEEIRFYNVTQDYPMPPTTWPTLTTGGVDVADPLPSPLSCLIFGRTLSSGRILRKFFAPFTEANQVDAEWDTAVPGACILLVNYLLSGWSVGTGSAYCGLYSYGQNVFLEVNEVIARSVPAYQRRRRRGRGA